MTTPRLKLSGFSDSLLAAVQQVHESNKHTVGANGKCLKDCPVCVAKGVKTESVIAEEAGDKVHRVGVTVSDPQHSSVSQRKEQIQKVAKVRTDNKESAIKIARQHYQKAGYKVHDAWHVGVSESTDFDAMDDDAFMTFVEGYEQLDEISKKTLASYVKKASHSAAHHSALDGAFGQAAYAANDANDHAWGKELRKKSSEHNQTKLKRLDGINKAVNKLTKEGFIDPDKDELDPLSEASKPKVHPMGIHVKKTGEKEHGQHTYHVLHVGKDVHGIEPGEKLKENELDDLQDMGHHIKMHESAIKFGFGKFLDESRKGPEFGKNWAAHATIADPAHHEAQAKLHRAADVSLQKLDHKHYSETGKNLPGGKDKMQAHVEWAQAHEKMSKMLRGKGPKDVSEGAENGPSDLAEAERGEAKFGRSWYMHDQIYDINHHADHAQKHYDAARKASAKGENAKSDLHMDWHEAHKRKIRELTAKKPAGPRNID